MNKINNKINLIVAAGVFTLLFIAAPVQAAQPSVITTAATGVTQTSATLTGYYSFTGTSIDVRFEYGTTTLLGTYTPIQTLTNSSGTFSAPITVQPNQQYFFRAIGVASGQLPGFGSTLSFTTPSYQSPTVLTLAATNVASTSATLNGFFNSNGSSTSTKFEYANNSAFVGSTITSSVSQNGTSGQFSDSISGLSPNTTYYFRAIGTNGGGTVNGSALNFLTTTNPPAACTINSFTASPTTVAQSGFSTLSWSTSNCTSAFISGIGAVSPVSSGSVSTSALSATTTFTLSATGNSGSPSQSVTVTVTTGNSNACVINYFTASPSSVNQYGSSTLAWSLSNCTYAYISSIGSVNTTSGSINTGSIASTTTFTLSASGAIGSPSQAVTVYVNQVGNNTAPTVITNAATAVNVNYATLNGYIDPMGSPTTYYFQYGTNANALNLTTPSATIYSSGNVNTFASNLSANTTYYFRLYGSNSNGSNYGAIQSFTTLNTFVPPPPFPVPAPFPAPQPNVVFVNTPSAVTSDLMSLQITTQSEIVKKGDSVAFNVSYRNISNSTLKNAVLTVTFPREIMFRQATSGLFAGNGLTLTIGTIPAGDGGNITIETMVIDTPITNNLMITTARLTFTKAGVQNEVVAYAFNKTSSGSSLAGLALFGENSFLPNTFIEWLLLILVILLLVYLSRTAFAPKKEVHVTH